MRRPPRARRSVSDAAGELVLDRRRVEPARGEQDVAVEPEVGELLDQALVALAGAGERGLDALPRRPCARRRPGPRRADGRRTSPRAAPSRARRPGARATARSTRASPCGRRARPGGRAGGSRRRRSRRGAPRRRACCRRSRPCARAPARERLQNHASPVSRVRRSASSSIQASISTRPSSASWTIAGVRSWIGHPASFSSRFSSGSRSGRSWTIEATSAASAPASNASARCAASPAPPEAITGTVTALRDRRASARGRSRRACRRRRST